VQELPKLQFALSNKLFSINELHFVKRYNFLFWGGIKFFNFSFILVFELNPAIILFSIPLKDIQKNILTHNLFLYYR
jgi:hypothetical protein